MRKTRKTKSKVRATSKRRNVKRLVRPRLTSQQRKMGKLLLLPDKRIGKATVARVFANALTSEQREVVRAERQAEKDFNAELKYNGLIDVQKTWYMPRFRKLAKRAAKYVRKLNETLNAMRNEYAWLDA